MNADIRKARIAMDKKHIGEQPLPDDTSKIGSKPGLLHTVAEKVFAAFGLMLLLTIPLFIIGKALGADRPFELFLCLPFPLSVVLVCLLFPFSDFAKDAAREKGYARIPKVTFTACFITALLAFLLLLAPTAVDLTASFDPPSIELTHLSAECRKGKDAVSENVCPTPDEWKLSGIDSGGAEYKLSIDRYHWERLEKIGTPYDKSWDVYRLEFGENVRLVGHWLPGSDKLIDWKIE